MKWKNVAELSAEVYEMELAQLKDVSPVSREYNARIFEKLQINPRGGWLRLTRRSLRAG